MSKLESMSFEHRGGRSKTSRSKEQPKQQEQPEKNYELRQTYQLNFNKVVGKDVTIDFNHPLAGKKLNFDLELLDVRDATPEELAHGHVHGPNGHHH